MMFVGLLCLLVFATTAASQLEDWLDVTPDPNCKTDHEHSGLANTPPETSVILSTAQSAITHISTDVATDGGAETPKNRTTTGPNAAPARFVAAGAAVLAVGGLFIGAVV
ncbi:hypothetical protein ABW19_dt0206489 [Dactylella cylindrospora]|nr:hypothetical protein ABW19_dt0206489 [Dactylella cylindrospora]